VGVENEEISVIIADDQVSTRRALKALLGFEPRIVIVGEAANGKEAIQLVSEKQPDLVLIDVHMPVLDGLKATQKIKSNWPDIKIVVYTMFPAYQEEAYRAGADYFLIKGSPGVTPAQIILSFFPLKDAISPDRSVQS
jgi:DNA-binding NarL/FixJ family response regulator